MKELFKEKEMYSRKKYTSKSYLNDILKIFYNNDRMFESKKIYELSKTIDKKSLKEGSNIEFIK